MGITSFEIQLLEKIIRDNSDIKRVCETGSQNCYVTDDPNPPFADTFYNSHGIEYTCIDLAGDNGALKFDLAYPIQELVGADFDLVTDFGTGEHIVQMEGYESVAFHQGHINSIYPIKIANIDLGYYNGWLNKHNMLKVGGIMVNVNPMTGNWPEHAYSFIADNFYKDLVEIAGYELMQDGVHAAMGNTENGWNVYGILRKVSNDFPDFETFKKLPIFKS